MATNLEELNTIMLRFWNESMAQEWRRHREEQAQMWNLWVRDVYGPYWADNKHVKEPEIPEYLRVSEGL